jgi:hypothetical protein
MSVVLLGSTSGSVTLQEPAVAGTTVLDLPATSGNVVVDSATQTLTNKSIAATQLTGTIAAARLPTGSVLQVVQGTTGTFTTTTGATYVDTTLTASITPTSSTSKILVLVAQNGVYKVNSAAGVNLKLQRNGSDIHGFAIAAFYGVTTELRGSVSTTYLDSPATTSSTTYKTVFSNDGSGTGSVTVQYNSGSSTSTITLLEIAA